MKHKTRNLFFAALVGLTVSSNGAVLFTEDFSDDSASPNMALGTGAGSPTTTTTGAFTITSGNGSRIYLGTNDTDYSTVDFSFEADVTIPNSGSGWSIAFIGMGSPNATAVGAPTYGEPLTGSHMMMAVRQDENTLQFRDNGVSGVGQGSIASINGTRGIRMDWNATTKQATFLFDLGNDGTYETSFTRDGSDNSFTGSNSQLFVGGGNGLTFDNISITSPVPEPSAALLGGLGVLGLLRRRRN